MFTGIVEELGTEPHQLDELLAQGVPPLAAPAATRSMSSPPEWARPRTCCEEKAPERPRESYDPSLFYPPMSLWRFSYPALSFFYCTVFIWFSPVLFCRASAPSRGVWQHDRQDLMQDQYPGGGIYGRIRPAGQGAALPCIPGMIQQEMTR